MPTAAANILEAMDTEKITLEIQQAKGPSRGAIGSGAPGSPAVSGATSASSPPRSIADTNLTDEDGRSLTSESGVHASQVTVPSPVAAAAAAGGDGGAQDGGAAAVAAAQRSRKTKRQLWDDLTISCECPTLVSVDAPCNATDT